MSNLKLSCNAYNMTPVPTEFLDTYMPHANGEFVKVYLRLLRLAASGQTSALSDVADTLSCTEKDVARALRYWEKAGLLKLQSDAGGEITGIAFVPITAETGGTGTAGTGADGNVTSERETNAPTDKTSALRRRVPESTVPKRKQLTAARITQLEDTEDFMYLLFVSGQYLGRNLTRTDIDTLGYFYDELHMGVDLIEYLIEYCVSNNHTSIRYIETVGLAWHSEGIATVEAAKDVSRKYNKDYYAILKALGIYNHSPISAEIQLMDKWMKTYSFTMDVIREACTRTVM